MYWTISSFPKCTHHVFLSHVAEDRERLVWPVYERLRRRGIAPWLDRHDYPSGRSSVQALRDGLLQSRHVVCFVTEEMLRQSRGWCVQELTWAELIQDNLIARGGRMMNVIVPLFFVNHAHRRLPRSVWQRYRDQGIFCSSSDPVRWATREVVAFLRREEIGARGHQRLFLESSNSADPFRQTPGLIDRISLFDPQSLQ